MKRFLQLICCVLLFVACENEGDNLNTGLGSEIAFDAENVESGRSVITQDDIDNDRTTIKVYAKQNGSKVLYDNVEIEREATGKWYPTSGKTEWQSGQSYSFYGYAYNTTSGLTISENGAQIVVNQPTTYDESKMVDYLLSYRFMVADGAMKPIVQLQLEHAMALVEVYVVRGNLFDARLKRLRFENIYSSGSLKCTTHAVANEGMTNVWEIVLSGNGNTTYELNPSNPVVIGDTRDNTEAKMRILCIPQQLTANAKLTVVYEVNEKVTTDSEDNWVEHSESFQLFKYAPVDYQSGHRILYTATIDSGVNLQAAIAEWKDVDYIEGTILPEIK